MDNRTARMAEQLKLEIGGRDGGQSNLKEDGGQLRQSAFQAGST